MLWAVVNGVRKMLTPGTVLTGKVGDVGLTTTLDAEGEVRDQYTLILEDCEADYVWCSGMVHLVTRGKTFKAKGVVASKADCWVDFSADRSEVYGIQGWHRATFSWASAARNALMVMDRRRDFAGKVTSSFFGAINLNMGARLLGGRYCDILVGPHSNGLWLEHDISFIPEGMGHHDEPRGGGPLGGVGLRITAYDDDGTTILDPRSPKAGTGIVCIGSPNNRASGRNPDGGLLTRGFRTAVACLDNAHWKGVIDFATDAPEIAAAVTGSDVTVETYIGDQLPADWRPGSKRWRTDGSSTITSPHFGVLSAGWLQGGAGGQVGPPGPPGPPGPQGPPGPRGGASDNSVRVTTDNVGRMKGPRKATLDVLVR